MSPEVFNRVEVWRLGWPKHGNVLMVFKSLAGLLGLVFGVIILLKNNISHLLTPILKTLLEFIFQNLSVQLCIHSPINLASISHPFPCHTPPHHQGPSSKLQSSFHQSIIESLSFLFPHPLLSICPQMINLSSDHITLFQSSTVQS